MKNWESRQQKVPSQWPSGQWERLVAIPVVKSLDLSMSQTLQLVQQLVARGEIRISEHGYDELSADGILVRDVLLGVANAVLIEDYPDYFKGPCVLVLQRGQSRQPVHVVWGIPKNATTPAVVVTAYKPEPDMWSDDFRTRL
jgi:uncharacterized protein DUF4258